MAGAPVLLEQYIKSNTIITKCLGTFKIICYTGDFVVKVAHCIAHNRTTRELFLPYTGNFIVEALDCTLSRCLSNEVVSSACDVCLLCDCAFTLQYVFVQQKPHTFHF